MIKVLAEYFPFTLIFISLNFFIIFLWNRKIWLKINTIYNEKHKIHAGQIPRLGGFFLYLTFLFIFLFYKNLDNTFTDFFISIFSSIFIYLLPLILVSLYEDLYGNVNPLVRIIFIMFSCILIMSLNLDLPIIDIPVIRNYFNNHDYLYYIFYIFCLMIVANGKNMIDGLNGLLILSSISMFLCLYKLSIIVGHSDLIYFSIIMIYFLSIILIFNYPIAKIFMGDTGAYFLGIICGISVIYFFGSNPEVLTWNAIVILFYPSFEVLFTILRRIFNNQNITSPDLDHNHNLLFRYIKKTKIKHPNSICTLFIFPQMLIPYFFIDYVFNDLVKVFILLSIQIFIYLSFHFIIKFLIKGRISLKQSI